MPRMPMRPAGVLISALFAPSCRPEKNRSAPLKTVATSERPAFGVVDEAVDPHARAGADAEGRAVEQQDLQLRALAGVDLVAPGEALAALDLARVPDLGVAQLDVADDGRGIADLDPLRRGRRSSECRACKKAGGDRSGEPVRLAHG